MDRKKLRERIEAFFNNKKNMYIAVAVACALAVTVMHMMPQGPDRDLPIMDYATFRSELEAGHVDRILYEKSTEYMTVCVFNDDTVNMSPEEREAYEYPEECQWRVKYPGGEDFRAEVLSYGATPTMMRLSDTFSTVMNIISLLLYLGLGLAVLGMVSRGPAGIAASSAKSLLKTSDVRFSDVVGQDEVIDDLKFIVDLMKNPKMGEDIGARIPKGLLLAGPPGTGKTLLAKAVAGEAGVPFIQMSGSAFIEMYVGLGAKRVRELFKLARKNAPCIIFIDEIDAIGCKRDKAGGTSENDQTINAMLEQMDGFTGRDGVFVIAATNRADQLDEALVRPGRFDRQVAVNPPSSWKVRQELFRHYLGQLKTDETVDIPALSRQTPGFTGADIAAVCNEAGIVAAMHGKPSVGMDSIEEAIDKKVFKGSRSKREQYEKDKIRVAWHEAGHAVMTWALNQPITRASVQPTTSGVGGAVIGADPDTQFMTDKAIRRQVAICYAGRIAETLQFRESSTGASNDITQATRLLKAYVESLGFDKDTGMLDLGVMAQDRIVSAQETVRSMRALASEIYANAEKILSENKNAHALECLATILKNAESLSGKEIDDILAKAGAVRMPPDYAP